MNTRNITEVTVISRKNDMLLVQWEQMGSLRRSWVTPDMVVENRGAVATVRDPNAGVPYGMDWTRVGPFGVTPVDIDRELKRRGIWSIDDLRARPNEVIGALMSAYGMDLARLLQWAKEFERMQSA